MEEDRSVGWQWEHGLSWRKSVSENDSDRIFEIREQDRTIARLCGAIGERIHHLFERGATRPALDFNCFGATAYTSGHLEKPIWLYDMLEQGQIMDVRDALSQLSLPVVFQICGREKDPDQKVSDQTLVHHTGLLFGKMSRGVPVAVEKDCWRFMRLQPWDVVLAEFGFDIEIEYTRFLSLSELQQPHPQAFVNPNTQQMRV
jgi:hypothetical protein